MARRKHAPISTHPSSAEVRRSRQGARTRKQPLRLNLFPTVEQARLIADALEVISPDDPMLRIVARGMADSIRNLIDEAMAPRKP